LSRPRIRNQPYSVHPPRVKLTANLYNFSVTVVYDGNFSKQ